MMIVNPLAREFVLFCINRRGQEWPALYDEMSRVAGRHLFRGLGYNELKKLGISLSLVNIDDTIKIVDAVRTQVQ